MPRAPRLVLDGFLYPERVLRAAAAGFRSRGRATLYAVGEDFEVELSSSSPAADEDLEGEFLNECLSVLAREESLRPTAAVRELLFTQAFLAARGGDEPKPPPPAELAEELERLLAEARRAYDARGGAPA